MKESRVSGGYSPSSIFPHSRMVWRSALDAAFSAARWLYNKVHANMDGEGIDK